MIRGIRIGEDPSGRVVEYHLDNAMRLRLSVREIEFYGEEELLRRHGVELSSRRVPVMRHGDQVGTLPASFDWRDFKSTLFVDLRPGDFIWRGDHWEASRTLGPGDLEAIPEFQRC